MLSFAESIFLKYWCHQVSVKCISMEVVPGISEFNMIEIFQQFDSAHQNKEINTSKLNTNLYLKFR